MLTSKTFSIGLCLALSATVALAETTGEASARKAAPILDTYAASEVLLDKVCMEGIFERQSLTELAKREEAEAVPAKSYGGSSRDLAWRIGPNSAQAYVVLQPDGSCTVRASGGDAAKLRALTERLIMARPEGFTRGASTPQENGKATRTIYCAGTDEQRLVASVTSTSDAPRGMPSLSSTMYRTKGSSPLCNAGA